MRAYLLCSFLILFACNNHQKQEQTTPAPTQPQGAPMPSPTIAPNPPSVAATTPKLSATIIVEIAEKPSGTIFSGAFKEVLTQSGCRVLTKVEAEKIWKETVLQKLEKETDLDAAADAAFGSPADFLVLGEAYTETTGEIAMEVKALNPSTGKLLWQKRLEGNQTTPQEAQRALAQDLARQLIEALAPRKTAPTYTLKLILSKEGAALTFPAAQEIQKALGAQFTEINHTTITELLEGKVVIELLISADASTFASQLDRKKIGAYQYVVVKSTADSLFIQLR